MAAMAEIAASSHPSSPEALQTSFDELDPSLIEGYTIQYEREVPIELRVAEMHEVP